MQHGCKSLRIGFYIHISKILKTSIRLSYFWVAQTRDLIKMNYNFLRRNKELLRVFLSISIIIVGITHFTHTAQYAKIVPPELVYKVSLVYISGFFEILGGVALLIPMLSVLAAWGLVMLFIAVFPANINQAINSIPIEGIPHHPILYWVRLPFQAVLITWAWWYTRQPQEQPEFDKIRPNKIQT
jgi:uncharacterized membrane protein